MSDDTSSHVRVSHLYDELLLTFILLLLYITCILLISFLFFLIFTSAMLCYELPFVNPPIKSYLIWFDLILRRIRLCEWHITMEMTLLRAARFAMQQPPTSVSAMLSDLGWETRRLHNRLTIMYKVTNGLVEVPQEYHPVPRLQYTARGHPRQFQCFQPAVDAFKHVFLHRAIPTWNSLPQVVAEADSTLDTFKRYLSLHQ